MCESFRAENQSVWGFKHSGAPGKGQALQDTIMKKQIKNCRIGVSCLVMGLAVTLLRAAQPDTVDQVTVKEGKPVILAKGELQPLKENLDLTSAIKVITNGTFTVNNGQPRKLAEGQVLDKQGMLTSPDGTVVPVLDHLTMRRGQVIVVRDGAESVLRQDMFLPDGVRVKPDGVIIRRDGRLRRLIDGQIVKLDGSVLAAQDTVTLRDGKVFVQRDGSQFPLEKARSIMMNDGTKVFGNGQVIKADGEVVQLSEGQILKLEGVAFKRR